MRIRTIKPEFWTHPAWSRRSDESRLLALALLNYADDEGYFFADVSLVQGQLMPFWDSTKVRRSLDEASRMGWIEVIDGPDDYGSLGRVVNFASHQRIDRGKPSKIRELWSIAEASTNDRRTIDERSTQEQGTGNREQGEEQGKEYIVEAGSAAPDRISAPSCPTKEIVTLYNEICGGSMPRAQVKTPARDAAIRRLWHFLKCDLVNVESFFHEAVSSDFLSGRNGKWKSCNLDWLCKTANAVKVVEGNYKNAGRETD